MSAQRVSMGSTDLVSSLPDEVLGKILSFLPTRRAASTSVLSKRWRNLLALVDKLDLSDASGDPRGFSDFVDKTLALLSNSSIIKRFSLNCQHKHEKTRVDSWIRTVLERGFLELHLGSSCLHCIETEFFTSNMLVKLTLLDGFCPAGPFPNGGVFFPKLKTLSLISVGFASNEMYEYLISGCPVLEELFLRYGDSKACNWMVLSHSIAVSSPPVKQLTISYDFPSYNRAPDSELFWTPSLVYFDYSGYVTEQYEVYLGSLVEARLDLRSFEERVLDVDGIDDASDGCENDNTEDDNGSGCGEDDDDDYSGFGVEENGDDSVFGEYENYSDSDCGREYDDDSGFGEEEDDDDDSCFGEDKDDSDSDGDAEDVLGDATNLVAGISNVKTLHLSPNSLEVLHSSCKSMPVFHNLLTLSFESDKERGWQVLPLLLNNSPNLETLVIKGLVHRVTDGCGDACPCIAKKTEDCLSTCHVKVLNISGYQGTRRERKQMRHFLGNLKCLETVKIGVEAENHREDSNVNDNYPRITNALLKLPRVSPKCQVHFF